MRDDLDALLCAIGAGVFLLLVFTLERWVF